MEDADVTPAILLALRAQFLCATLHAHDVPQEAKKLLEEKFKTGKNRWFFTKLRF